jgi:hypothetical protein
LLLYHGVLAGHARDRAQVVATTATGHDGECGTSSLTAPAPVPRRHYAWADLLRRIFAIDVLACTCGGRLRFIATIDDPVVVERILGHVGLPTVTPEPATARSPPASIEPRTFDA